MPAEKQLENKIKAYLTSIGAYHVKFFGCAFTKAGVPDLLVCLNGRFIAIEVKAEKGRPSNLQIYNLNKINEAGGIGLLIYPKNFEDLKNFLDAVKNNNSKVINELYDKFKEYYYKDKKI